MGVPLLPGPRDSIERLPLRIVMANLLATGIVLAVLAALYVREGDREILLALLLIGLLTPMDTVVLYALFKSQATHMLKVLEAVERTGPSALQAPLGLKIIATWHTGGAIKTLSYSGKMVKAITVRPIKILGEQSPTLLTLLRIPLTPARRGRCTWALWNGLGQARTLSPRGTIISLEGQIEAWTLSCDNLPDTAVHEALARLDL